MARITVGFGVRRSVYGATRQEVQQRMREVQQSVESGLPLGDGRLTMAQFFEGWLKAVEHRLRRSTWNRYCELIVLHVVPLVGSARLITLTPQHI
jgi:hypothetical protein